MGGGGGGGQAKKAPDPTHMRWCTLGNQPNPLNLFKMNIHSTFAGWQQSQSRAMAAWSLACSIDRRGGVIPPDPSLLASVVDQQ